ncbi:MAG: glycosyltransferase family 2 protein [Prochloraceae cyanobacterium]|nr:glycosyltransferase family 2 protein [Prochloraceae cyanobacterium]
MEIIHLDDMEIIHLDPIFSTTRLLAREQLYLDNNLCPKGDNLLFLPPKLDRQGEGGLRKQGYFKLSYSEVNAIAKGENLGKINLSSNTLPLPLVTIITVVFNAEEYLEQTIESVINQTYDNIEYVIIDGGSKDGTLDIIREYEEAIDYWVSEPDEGIADAMNKGINLSSGILINHLHAGDRLASKDIVSYVVSTYNNEQWRWCFGNQALRDSSGNILGTLCPPRFSSKLLNIVNTIPHQTVFSEKSLMREVGCFDNRYKCAMDYHLWLRFAKVAQPKQLNKTIAEFLLGGRSSNTKLALTEEFKARTELLNFSIIAKLFSLVVVLIRYIKRKLNLTTFVKSN